MSRQATSFRLRSGRARCGWSSMTRPSTGHVGRRSMSIAAKIGCTPQTLLDWVKKAEVDSGKRAGVPTGMVKTLKALERENREL